MEYRYTFLYEIRIILNIPACLIVCAYVFIKLTNANDVTENPSIHNSIKYAYELLHPTR